MSIKSYITNCMWYFIAGNFMSFGSFLVLNNYFLTFPNYSLLSCSISWFLTENIFDEYYLPAGKVFLINEDFRTLIKNFLIITRNLLFLSQIFSPLEFIFINIIFVWSLTKTQNLVKLIVIICYIFFLQSFLFFNFFFIYSCLKNVSLFVLFIATIIVYFYMLYWICLITLKNSLIKLFLMKNCIWFFIILINVSFILIFMCKKYSFTENVIHELCLNIFLPYMYLSSLINIYIYNLC